MTYSVDSEAALIVVYETKLADQVKKNVKALKQVVRQMVDVKADQITDEIRQRMPPKASATKHFDRALQARVTEPKLKEHTMDKMIVVVFDTEAKAYDGLRALSDLH